MNQWLEDKLIFKRVKDPFMKMGGSIRTRLIGTRVQIDYSDWQHVGLGMHVAIVKNPYDENEEVIVDKITGGNCRRYYYSGEE